LCGWCGLNQHYEGDWEEGKGTFITTSTKDYALFDMPWINNVTKSEETGNQSLW